MQDLTRAEQGRHVHLQYDAGLQPIVTAAGWLWFARAVIVA
jgi:hypothetical protein